MIKIITINRSALQVAAEQAHVIVGRDYNFCVEKEEIYIWSLTALGESFILPLLKHKLEK